MKTKSQSQCDFSILLMLYSVCVRVFSNMCCIALELSNLNYVHGVTLELKSKDK